MIFAMIGGNDKKVIPHQSLESVGTFAKVQTIVWYPLQGNFSCL